MPQEIAINKLKPHPRNELIYGQEDVKDLVAQIEERGRIVVPIIINKDNVILSGHRRWGAAKELELETVPCEVREFESSEDELEFLLHSNVSRKKSREQIAREGIALEEVLSVQSVERRNEKLKQYQTVRDNSSTTDTDDENNSEEAVMGRTRDEVAKALRIGSGKQYDRMKAVIKKADELKAQGRTEDAELFLAVLNRSVSAANDLMDVSLESLSDEDREGIRSGKIAPRMFTQEHMTGKSKRKSAYEKSVDGINIMEDTIKSLKKSINLIKDWEEKKTITSLLNKTI